MIKKLIFSFFFFVFGIFFINCNESANNGDIETKADVDTISLLASKEFKFWDIQKTENSSNNHTGEYLNWMFTIDKKLVEYSYESKKRITHIYGGDIIIGELEFDVRKDTIWIKELNEKYVIKKLMADTLMVQHVGEYGIKSPIVFVRSFDQITLPK